MSYGAKMLKARGIDCSVIRGKEVPSKLSMKKATKSIYAHLRDALREGVILLESNLQPGEVFKVIKDKYLASSVNPEYAFGQIEFFAYKINAEVIHSRYVETENEWGNIVQEWQTITPQVYAYAEVVTASLRQFDPGLLETTAVRLYVPDTAEIQKLDRCQYLPEGKKLQVDAIDDVKLPGIVQVQCSQDTRTDEEISTEEETSGDGDIVD